MFCKVKNILARRVSEYTGNLEYLVEWQEEKKKEGERVDCDHTGYLHEWNSDGFSTDTEKRVEEVREENCMTELEMAERALRLCWAPRAALLSFCPDAVEEADQKEVNRVDALLRRWRSTYVDASLSLSSPLSAVGTPFTQNKTPAPFQKVPSSSSETPTTLILKDTSDDKMEEGRRGPPMEREATHESIRDRTQWSEVDQESAAPNDEMGEEKKNVIASTFDLAGEKRRPSGIGSHEVLLPVASDRETVLPCTPLLHVSEDRSVDWPSVSAVKELSFASLPSGSLKEAAGRSSFGCGTSELPQAVERLHGIVWRGKGGRRKGGSQQQKCSTNDDRIPCNEEPLSCTLPLSSSLSSSSVSSTSFLSNRSPRLTPPSHFVSPLPQASAPEDSTSSFLPSSRRSDAFYFSSSSSSTPTTVATGLSTPPYVILLGDVILSEDAATVLNPAGGNQKKKKKRRKATSPLMLSTSFSPASRESRQQTKRGGGGKEEDGALISSIEELCTPSQEVEKAWRDMFANSFLHSCVNSSRCTPLINEFSYTSDRLVDSSARTFWNRSAENSPRSTPRSREEVEGNHLQPENGVVEKDKCAETPIYCPAPSLSESVYTNALRKWVRIIDIVPVACSTHASLHYKDPVSIVSLVGMEEAERLKNRVTTAASYCGSGGSVNTTSNHTSGGGGSAGGGGSSGTRPYPTSRNNDPQEEEGVSYSGSLFALKEESALVTELLRPQEEQLVVRCLIHHDVGLPFLSPPPLLQEIKEEDDGGFQGGNERMETRKRRRLDREEELRSVIKKEEEDTETKSNSVVKDASGVSWTFVTLPLAVCRLSFPQLLIDYLLQHALVLEAE